VVVIQAPERSGALITADFALSQGRDLFVHRIGVTGPASRGSADLVEDGAEVISRGRDILKNWGWSIPPEIDGGVNPVAEASSEETGKRLAECLERELAARRALSQTEGQARSGS
jgi:DNA processing protein